ncbi:MAG: LysM domain-containing protein [Planctomycetota bacterium]
MQKLRFRCRGSVGVLVVAVTLASCGCMRPQRATWSSAPPQKPVRVRSSDEPVAPGTDIGLHVAEPGLHFVARGDTLYGVARRYGTTVAHLRRLNPGLSASTLRVGEGLVLPAGKPRMRAIVAPERSQ